MPPRAPQEERCVLPTYFCENTQEHMVRRMCDLLSILANVVCVFLGNARYTHLRASYGSRNAFYYDDLKKLICDIARSYIFFNFIDGFKWTRMHTSAINSTHSFIHFVFRVRFSNVKINVKKYLILEIQFL